MMRLCRRTLYRYGRLQCLVVIGLLCLVAVVIYDTRQDFDDSEDNLTLTRRQRKLQPSRQEDDVNKDETLRTYEAKISDLQQEIRQLQQQLSKANAVAMQKASSPQNQHQPLDEQKQKLLEFGSYFRNHFDQTLRDSEIVKGVALNNEYEVFPFCRFTLKRLYLVDPGLGKRVVEKPIGRKKKEIYDVVNAGVNKLNEKFAASGIVFTEEDFLEGIYRTEPALGTHYELYFVEKQNAKVKAFHYNRVVISRPFGPLHFLGNELIETRANVIHIILPLKGRLDKFSSFMERFIKVCVQYDRRVTLTVVYFGTEGLQNITTTMGNYQQAHQLKNINLVRLDGEFSRGRGLQEGAQSLAQSSSERSKLMFFCDVDIVFSTDFLERCRLNAKEGSRVYYPIVFSLYNPQLVYELQEMPTPTGEQLFAISKNTGFWRDFGYGMTCQYWSDFQAVGGFDSDLTGWGIEDVNLYKKYLQSSLLVIRATDPGIFHQWHEKYCDPNLSQDQYIGCIRSKALNEASHAQLGLVAFKEEVDLHKSIKRKVPAV